MDILERSLPMQFFMTDQRLNLVLGRGGTTVLLWGRVGRGSTKKLGAGSSGT